MARTKLICRTKATVLEYYRKSASNNNAVKSNSEITITKKGDIKQSDAFEMNKVNHEKDISSNVEEVVMKKNKKNQKKRKDRIRRHMKQFPEMYEAQEKRRKQLEEDEQFVNKAKDMSTAFNLNFDDCLDLLKKKADNKEKPKNSTEDIEDETDSLFIKEKLPREPHHYVDDDGKSQFTVKCIRNQRTTEENQVEYLVEWNRYEELTWVAAEDLINSQIALREFHVKIGLTAKEAKDIVFKNLHNGISKSKLKRLKRLKNRAEFRLKQKQEQEANQKSC